MKIFVIKNNQHYGTLEELSSGITFTYASTISKKEYAQGLQNTTNLSKHLFPLFENMLPEHQQLELLKQQNNIRTQIEVLLYLSDIHGSYEFYTEEDFSKLPFKSQEIFYYQDAKKEILDSHYIFPNILDDYKIDIEKNILYPTQLATSKVIGLSGFQYKFSIIKDEKNKTISYDSDKNSHYFMKPYNLYYTTFKPFEKQRSYIPYLLINEHIFMTLARDFGFDIPYNAIIKHNHDYHYIIKRYDRYQNNKIDHHEILTLMNKSSDYKYKVTMREVFDTLKQYLGQNELIEVYKFMVFSVIIGHGDLHAKNLSLIYTTNKLDEEKMSLAPYYDISTTKIYKDTKHYDIGLKIENKQKNINKENLIKFASFVGIKECKANEIIENIGEKFIQNFQNYIKALPNDIKTLPYYLNRYKAQKPFETILNEYYQKRVQYINTLLENSILKQNEDIWN